MSWITSFGWHPALALALGVVCAFAGGQLFVQGALGAARWLRIAPGIVGATVAAFATSSPELAVALQAARAGALQVALGNALGANLVNVALILGIVLVFGGLRIARHEIERDLRAALLAPALTAALLLDGTLSRGDGLALLALFAVWLLMTVAEALRQRHADPQAAVTATPARLLVASAFGLMLLTTAGALIVDGGRGLAARLGIGDFVIGASIVALGTTAPELATTIAARLQGHDDVGVGTLLGSNLFNGLFIVGLAAVIHPIAVLWHDVAVALLCGAVALALVVPARSGRIERQRGIWLLVLYVVYLLALVQRPGA